MPFRPDKAYKGFFEIVPTRNRTCSYGNQRRGVC